MKLFNLIVILATLISLTSCSSSKKKKAGGAEGEEMAEFSEGEGDDFVLESEGQEMASEEESADFSSDGMEGGEMASAEASSFDNSEIQSGSSGETASYNVKSGDTLMLIAFKIYGDYSRWRALADMNGTSSLSAGSTIKYKVPSQKFVWNPKGLPYLIRSGDTLGTISMDKYGTKSKWKALWENNRPMIKDPNLIFAGFTMYYVADQNLASD